VESLSKYSYKFINLISNSDTYVTFNSGITNFIPFLDINTHCGRVKDIYKINLQFYFVKVRLYEQIGKDEGYGLTGLPKVALTEHDFILPCNEIAKNVHITPINLDYKIDQNKVKYKEDRTNWESISFKDWEDGSYKGELLLLPLI